MKVKKSLALLLVLTMLMSLLPAMSLTAAAAEDPLSIADAEVTTLTPTVDGEAVEVTWYADCYLANPNSPDKQMVNVYVPENATEASPIMLYVNNGGWRANDYPTNTIEDGKDYDGTNNKVGVALSRGYIVVSYGCRSRGEADENGVQIGHSPATMTDTKAVIRWLRYNDAAIPGDTDRIVVTGTSGGGALSAVIAASGDSSDYYESLYEVGAAGIDYVDGEYVSTISDAVWGTIAYCPITDFGNACAAYDWQWGETRAQLMAEELLSYKGATAEQVNANAEALTALYEEYVDSLDLIREDGTELTAANLRDTIIALMEKEIDEALVEVGAEQMMADIAAFTYGENDWLTINADGTYDYDYDAHLYWICRNTNLKISPAFSNVGTGYGEFMNEDNLFGSSTDPYSPFNARSWEIDATENAVGQDDTGMTWDEYIQTEDGQRLLKQIRMTSGVEYLNQPGDANAADHWYVRYGMQDRDSSFAVETILYYSLLNAGVEDVNFEFAWLKPHSGDYDVAEAYAWLEEALAEDADPLSFKDAEVTYLYPHLDGKEIAVKTYIDSYAANPNRPEDQMIQICVPENATADSPIIFLVDNSGWQSDAFASQKGVKSYGTEMGFRGEQIVGDYSSTDSSIGVALTQGYVIVSLGARSRSNGETDGEYLGHSPATMTDTKAAIRYLRYNADILPAGDPEKIVISGTSGGGALSVVIAASGNSADYFESLYEIGAAGIVKNADGSYSSVEGIGDNVWATIAYCPITDLGNACAAYEWTWGDARDELIAEGHEMYSGDNAYGVPADELSALSDEMAAAYEVYVDSLGLEGLSSENLRDAVIALMEKEITEAISEVGIEQMKEDLKGADWLTINDDGSFVYDFEAHCKWVGTQTKYKTAPAFSNTGMGEKYAGERNEDNLFGSRSDAYSPFNKWSWERDAVENAVGKDDTGLTWEQYIETEDGQALLQQIKMTSPIQYLLDDADGDSAPYWYVRYGMADRDSSFAVETVLYYSLLNAADVDEVDFEFAWLKPHSGDYDVPEAYAWLNSVVKAEDPEVCVSEQNVTVDGEAVEAEVYNINGYNYFKIRDMAALLNGTGSQFSVDFDEATNVVTVESGKAYVAVGGELDPGVDASETCIKTLQTVIIDGMEAKLSIYNIGDNNFIKLRDLGEALGFGVGYDAATNTAVITTK
ncbi:MAG: subtype B tannase [Oscillospiraceae bacterium]